MTSIASTSQDVPSAPNSDAPSPSISRNTSNSADGMPGHTDCQPGGIVPTRLRAERLATVHRMMAAADLAAVILFDPNNQRYATGSRNMFGYFLRNSTRYIYVPLEGPVILFEYPGSAHVSTWLETIDEARTSKIVWSAVNSRDHRVATPFAQEIAALVRKHGGGNRRVGLDRCAHLLAVALDEQGLQVEDCMGQLLHARRIKTVDEVECLRASMTASEAAVAAVEAALQPGISEIDLFAGMYGQLIRQGGEFIETRLLSSGPRTNPWFNEAGDRRVRPGELVALDTDAIGCYGYYSDFSRTFYCGSGRPSGYQRSLYRMAYEQVQTNMALLRPGLSYRELAERAWPIPERFHDRRYPSIVHGVGLHGETPLIAHCDSFDAYSENDLLLPGMVLSVESYIGEPGGAEGVKLEEEVVITDSGYEQISRYPYDDRLLEQEH